MSKYTGDNSDRICPMEVVEKRRVLAGQMFSTKDIVWMQIAGEANRRQITIKTELSDCFNLYVSDDNF